jgi:hypothetical protein
MVTASREILAAETDESAGELAFPAVLVRKGAGIHNLIIFSIDFYANCQISNRKSCWSLGNVMFFRVIMNMQLS